MAGMKATPPLLELTGTDTSFSLLQLPSGRASFFGTDRHKFHNSLAERSHAFISYLSESHASFIGTDKHKGLISFTGTGM